jgi:biopolymer transport protein ExbD
MTTRPLELAARLRPEPRSLDWLHFVNAGLLVLFFSLFNSQFVLAPGLNVSLPQTSGARAGATTATHHISVDRSGIIFIDAGPASMEGLKKWLHDEGAAWKGDASKKAHAPTLLVRASNGVAAGDLMAIAVAAYAEGFNVVWAAEDALEGGR